MMQSTPEPRWRELYRCDDYTQANAVATSIAAMEFDVRLRGRERGIRSSDADHTLPSRAPAISGILENRFESGYSAPPGPGPYIIEVPDENWTQLRDVLSEIVDEQVEFDLRIQTRRARNQHRVVLVLSITTAAEVLLIWRLVEA